MTIVLLLEAASCTFSGEMLPVAKPSAPVQRMPPAQPPAAASPGAPVAQETTTATAPALRPNIVVILVDDMEAEPIVYMPNLQALLIEQGVSFQNFFVNVSMCCPSRASLLRGQYAHNTQIFANLPPAGGFRKFRDQGEETSTIATWLQGAGYRTALVGKYLNGYPAPEDPAYIPPGWDEWYSPSGGKPYTQYRYTLNENGRLVEYRASPKAYATDVLAGKAIDFVTRSAGSGAPFFALITPYAPHGPSTPARRHAKLFPSLQAPRPPSFNERGVADKPKYIRSRPRLNEKQITRIDRLYRKRVRALQAVDEMIGSLVEALRAAGALENTYIFFSSDNGFMLGQHRLGTGKVVPYEESIRVPLIARGPGVPAGLEIAQLAGNVDLAPTWAELAGATAPGWVDGRSLVSLWRGTAPAAGWRRAFLIQYGPARQPPGEEPSALETPGSPDEPGILEPPDTLDWVDPEAGNGTPLYRALRLAGGAIYIEYETGEKEFYNLIEDPYQLENQAGLLDPARQARLSAWLEALSRCAGETCREIESSFDGS
jgi:arylsulfatase A-like enzyme